MSNSDSEPPVYFVRHNFKGSAQVVEMLKRRKRVAIRFTTAVFHRWEQYSNKDKKHSGFKRAWDCFQEVRENGAIVLAQYLPNEYLIGKVRKGSRLKFISTDASEGLKTLKLHATRNVSNKQHSHLAMIKPMYSTISRMRNGAQYVLNAYGVGSPRESPDSLTPMLQETMCAEWLRSEHCPKSFRLDFLLASPGKTMESVDILGRTINGEKLYCQVTHAKGRTLQKKLEVLQSFSEGSGVNIMFSNENASSKWRGVKNISLDTVWKNLYRDKRYRKMLQEMIGK